MGNNGAVRAFGWRDKIGYLLGNLGNDLTFTFASVYLLVFYTKVLGIASELVGTMFLIARFLDAFTDITMGRIVDRCRGNKGNKFKRWLLWMSGPVALASFLMYQSSLANAQMWVKVLYMFVTYILWGSVFYTAVNIPYGSMASVISSSPDDRAVLSTVRSVGSLIANLLIGVGVAAVVYTENSDGDQVVRGDMFPRAAAVLSVLAFVSYILCYVLTEERIEHTERTEMIRDKKNTALKTLGTLVTDRALIGIVIASVCVLAAQLLNQSINQYLFIDYFNNKSGVMIMSVLSIIPGLLLAPVAVPLCKRFGKKEIGIFGCMCGAVSCLLLFIIQTKSMWLYIAVNFFGFLGFGVFNLIMWAFITDIIDDREVRCGRREDGTVYAVYSFARKVGQAIAGGLGGWALSWIGFESYAAVQNERVSKGIYNISTLIPAILYFAVGIALAFIYPLDKKRVDSNSEELKKRKTQKISDDIKEIK